MSATASDWFYQGVVPCSNALLHCVACGNGPNDATTVWDHWHYGDNGFRGFVAVCHPCAKIEIIGRVLCGDLDVRNVNTFGRKKLNI